MHFKKCLDQSKISVAKSKEHKPNKICVDNGSEFGTKSIKTCSQDHNTQIYSTHNELKSVAAEKIVRNLENKIYKHKTAISKNVYIDKLDDMLINEITDIIKKSIINTNIHE